MNRSPSLSVAAAFSLLSLALIAACATAGRDDGAQSSPDSLIVYCGRNERLIGPLLESFREQSGIDVQVRYAGTAELAAQLLEEGAASPADLFISQDAAALGKLSQAGLLAELPSALLERVPARFRSNRADWVGLSGRARTVVYNPERIMPAELPQTLEQLADPKYRGRFGLAPTNASFQAHMALYRALNGADALQRLLAGIVVNEPLRYPKNTPIVEAVIAGEIDWGLVNHYYLWRALQESPGAPAKNFFMPGGDASSFINMAGAGLLRNGEAGRALVRFLLSEQAQRYFADQTFEYPLVPEIAPAVELPTLAELATPNVDYADVSDALEATLEAIHASGLMEH